jgi:hypothetical protein
MDGTDTVLVCSRGCRVIPSFEKTLNKGEKCPSCEKGTIQEMKEALPSEHAPGSRGVQNF